MARQKIKRTLKTSTRKTTYRKSQTKGKGNHKRCKTCGRFM